MCGRSNSGISGCTFALQLLYSQCCHHTWALSVSRAKPFNIAGKAAGIGYRLSELDVVMDVLYLSVGSQGSAQPDGLTEWFLIMQSASCCILASKLLNCGYEIILHAAMSQPGHDMLVINTCKRLPAQRVSPCVSRCAAMSEITQSCQLMRSQTRCVIPTGQLISP